MPSNFKLPADYRKHSITFLTFYGKEKFSTQENLFETVSKFKRRFVIDNNIGWFELSGALENADSAFILGTTVDKEASPLRLLLEKNDRTPKVRHNVFLFGMKSPTPKDVLAGDRTPLLVISRLDAHVTNVLNMDGLRKFDLAGDSKTKWDTSESICDEKQRVLSLLGVNTIDELTYLPGQGSKDEELRLSIDQKRRECIGRFWESNDVSRSAYARLLLCSPQARSEFARVNYCNVFGDRDLLQNALFFNADILSNDKGVKKMARCCGLRCLEAP